MPLENELNITFEQLLIAKQENKSIKDVTILVQLTFQIR